MPEPTEEAKSILLRYREGQGLPGAHEARLRQTFVERIARGDGPRFAIDVPPPAMPAAPGAIGAALGPLGKAALGLGALAAVAVPVWRSTRPASQPAPESLTVAAGPEHAPAEVAAPAALEEPLPSAATASRASSAPLRDRGRASSEATIDDEVNLLHEAQAAMRAGQPKRALSLLDQHAARFPAGKLADARDVAHMSALCDLGQPERARAEAERFLERHPSSPFSDRVRHICGTR